MLMIDKNQISKIVKEFGCPLYVFDENSFVRNYEQLKNSFQTIYPKYRISYSYKTNYAPYICSIVKRLGGYAEVVSAMELDIAKCVGYEPYQIVFNGPDKGREGIEAVLNGCIVNVDNLVELEEIVSSTKTLDGQYQIGLRVNLDIGQSFISRFGMDENDLDEAFKLIDRVPNIKVVGLHCHISRCRSLDAWRKRTQIMLNMADKYFKDKPPLYLDLGSGMFGEMDKELKEQFPSVPTYDEYAEVTAGILSDHYLNCPEENKPFLFTEPGTTLVNKYVDFIGRVDAIKDIRGKEFIILNCSEHNLGETCTLKKLPIRVINISKKLQALQNATLVGYTCLEQDVMYEGFNGKIGVGDLIQFGNVGGYSNVYKPPFIWPNCAMIAITEKGEFKLMKSSETYEDLLHTYVY